MTIEERIAYADEKWADAVVYEKSFGYQKMSIQYWHGYRDGIKAILKDLESEGDEDAT